MAEKSGDLNNIDKLDPVSTAAGAGSDAFLEKYAEDYPEGDAENLEMSADADDASEETEHIKAQIEETRSSLGDTIDAIQERLSFANISEQVSEQVNNAIETAKDSVYEATIGKVVNYMKNAGKELSSSSMITTAKENPLPFVLIGLGAGLLAYNSFSKKQNNNSTSKYRYSGRSNYGAGERTGYRDSNSGAANRSVLTTAQEKLGSVTDGISDAASSAYDGVSSVAGKTYSGAGDIANLAYDKAGELGSKAQETYSYYLEEQPWAIGAVALALGAAVGMAIPSTRYEGELMGEARYNLMSKAQETASDLVDKAKQVATEAGKTITDEAKSITDKI